MMILPRQARDKHRENSKKSPFSRRMLVFHHHPWFNATSVPTITPAQVKVTVCGFEKSYGPGPSISSVSGGTMWKLDDLHGQFWPTWEDDLLMANVNTSVPGDSWVQDGGNENASFCVIRY